MTRASRSSEQSALATRCVHAGHRADGNEPSVVTPIVRASTFLLDDEAYRLRAAGQSEHSRVYARETNPTIEALERKLAALEGAAEACVFGSGMAALHTLLMAHTKLGRGIAIADRLYGGSTGLVRELAPRLQAPVVRFDPTDPESLQSVLASAAAERPTVVLIESLANPNLEVADIRALADRAHSAGALLVVDATFASPVIQRAHDHGADLVWHSATKILGGHTDLLGGVVTGSTELITPVRRWRTRTGGVLDPEPAYLLERGLKTLHLRVAAQSENATRVAAHLAAHAQVSRVRHPSLFTGVEASAADTMLDLPGWMLTFCVDGGDDRAARFIRKLELILEAASLGGVETLISQPMHLSHPGLTPEQRIAAGVHPGCVRLSVGIEDADDLIADLEQALVGSR